MQHLFRKFNEFAYSGDTFVARWRAERMRAFQRLVRPPGGARIVDLGGTAQMWTLIPHDYQVTLVNLPGTYRLDEKVAKAARVELVEGDACDLGSVFKDGQFDVVFSNSVIEHVGDEAHQQAFANEVRRLAPRYWIQTPSENFPIEAHTGVPFYFRLPQVARDALERRWRAKLPAWTDFIQGTTVLSLPRMQELFPGSEVYVERKLLFEKSYACYRAID